MKGLILLIAICCLVLLNGCASVTYKSADGTEVSYSRLFMNADSIEAEIGTAKMKVNNPQVDIDALTSVLRSMGVMK